jgi:hypothetical protein
MMMNDDFDNDYIDNNLRKIIKIKNSKVNAITYTFLIEHINRLTVNFYIISVLLGDDLRLAIKFKKK